MNVISFYDSDRQAHWLAEIGKSDWSAGRYLYDLLQNGTFFDAEVYISTDTVGLYEKYGCVLRTKMKDLYGQWSNVYVKPISQ